MKPSCKLCNNSYSFKGYFTGKKYFRCKHNTQSQNKGIDLKCNKINDFYAFEPKKLKIK